MMTALAHVSRVERLGEQLHVSLSCQQQTSCSSCSSQKSCGTGIISKAVGNKSLTWELVTSEFVEPGDQVEIGFPEKTLLMSAAVVYLLPLFALIIGATIGQFGVIPALEMLSGHRYGEGIVILTASLASVAGFLLAKSRALPLEQDSKARIVLIRVLGKRLL